MTNINAVFNNVEGVDLYLNNVLLYEGSNDVPFTGNYPTLKIVVHSNYEVPSNFSAELVYVLDDGMGGTVQENEHIDLSGDGWNVPKTIYEDDIYAPSYMIPEGTTFTFNDFVATPIPPQLAPFEFILNNVENCSLYLNEVLLVNGETMEIPWWNNTHVVLKIVANEGFYFDETFIGSYSYSIPFGGGAQTEEVKYVDSGWNDEHTLYEGNTVFYGLDEYSYDRTMPITFSNFSAKSDETPSIEIVNVFANIYNPTPAKLLELAEARYKWVGESLEVIDIGRYISELYVLPFSIEDIVQGEEPVVIGGEVLEINMNQVESSKIAVDIGTIEVPHKYNNSYDIINTTCNLILPFTHKREIDIARIIGKAVSIIYVIRLYTGETTCNILVENEVLESFPIEVVEKIPFTHSEEQVFGSIYNNRLDNGVAKPYIEVVRNIPYNELGSMGMNVEEYVQLSEVEGYVEISKIDLVGSATKREKQEIERLLSAGVFIQ